MDKNDLAKLLSSTFTPEDGALTLLRSTPFVGWDASGSLTISEEAFPLAEASSFFSVKH